MTSIGRMVLVALATLGAMDQAMAAVVIDSGKTGFTFNVDYLGRVNGEDTKDVSASGSFTFTGLSKDLLTYNFSYVLTNDSVADSRLRSFGFNEISAATISKAAATGTYAFTDQNVNYPEGVGKTEICFAATDNGTCTGGKDGLTSNPDQTGKGTFSLTLEKALSSLTLDDFVVRFQSIAPKINGGDSGVGLGTVVGSDVVVSAAPEPMTWAMMIIGFGLIGNAMRRRYPALLRA